MRFGRDISRGVLGLPRLELVEEKSFTVAQYLSSINYRTGIFSPERQYLEFTVTLSYPL
jgi:hypothetical protein